MAQTVGDAQTKVVLTYFPQSIGWQNDKQNNNISIQTFDRFIIFLFDL